MLAQVNLHERGIHCGVAGVDGGKVGRDADIGNDHLQITLGNDGADIAFNLCDVFVGDFQASAGGSFDVEHELTGVRAREVSTSDKREKHGEEYHDESEDVDSGTARSFQRARHFAFVIVQQALEGFVELVDQFAEPAFGILVALFAVSVEANEIGSVERNDGHAKNVRSEDGNDHPEGQVREEVATDAIEETDREKDDGGRGRGRRPRESDLHAAFFRRFARSHALLHEAEDVFEYDHGVVDQ